MDRQKRTRGQSLVEFAFCLPVLVLLLVGIFDLGRAFNAHIVITNAAREGAYYGSMYPHDTSGISDQVINEAQGSGIPLAAEDIAISTTGAINTPVSVTVTYDFAFITSYFFGGAPLTLQGRADMMVVMEL